MRQTCRLMLIFLVFLSTQVFGQAIPYENQVIDKIDITIATDAKSKGESVRSRLKTKEGSLFSQNDFDADLKLLVKDYDRVEPLVESENGKIHITLKVWAKPKIRRINWEGNCKVKEKHLNKELGVAKGSVFDRQEFNKAFHKIKAYYVKKGFFEAQLAYSVSHNDETNEVEITIEICEGRAGMISEICFSGFTPNEEYEITELMVTKRYNLFLSWLYDSGRYNEEMIQHDKYQILNYMQNKGYADATVDIAVEEAKKANRILLKISADRGAYYTFGPITFEGNTIFNDEKIENTITVSEGDPFSTEAIHNTIEAIMDLYGSRGYIEAVVNYEPVRCADGYGYSVRFTISEGEQYRVGMIKVLGNCVTQTKVILHESLIVPGEIFNSNKLKLTEKRLQNIGYFKNVNVYAVRTEPNSLLPENYRDVHIEVEETTTGNIGAFLGFSTSEDLFGGLNLTEKNFNIEGLFRLNEEGASVLRGGGEYAHATATVGQKSRSYGLSWTKPYFRDTAWSVGFDLENSTNEYISKNYNIQTTGLTLHAAYPYNAFVKMGTHYRIHYTRIHISEYDHTVKNADGTINKEESAKEKERYDKEIKKAEHNSGLLSAIGCSWLYDSTDSPVEPTSGLKSRIEAELAGLGGSKRFVSFGYINTWYYDLWGEAVLKVRGYLRFLEPVFGTSPNDIPLDERFFLGGENELRGYRPYRVGPKLAHDNDDPEGGISLQLFSAEVSRPLFSKFETFVFFDAGALSEKRFHFAYVNFSVGFGCRFQVFESAPPLAVGMGFPLNARDSSDVKKFFLNIGGKF